MQSKNKSWKLHLASGLLAACALLPAPAQTPAAKPALPAPSPAGSGFFVTSNGYFITCSRVIKNADVITIQQAGRLCPAKVVGADVDADLVLLKVEGGPFPCLPIEDPQNMVGGENVYAAGFPALNAPGAAAAFTAGTLKGLTGPKDDPKFLQVEVPVQAGNYGGPLLDKCGNVIGIVGLANAAAHYPVKSIYIDPLFDSIPDARNAMAPKSAAAVPLKDLQLGAGKAVGLVLLPRAYAARPGAPGSAAYVAEQSTGFKEPPFTYKYYEGGNLLRNGTFSNGLDGWRFKYDLDGESWYTNNHNCVSVITDEQTHQTMVKLVGTHAELLVPGMGVKLDSAPIPIKPTDKFKLSCWAKSSGPDCRILVYGYKWKPGIKPHADPILPELRECYHSVQVYFTVPDLRNRKKGDLGIGAGDFGGVKKDWRQSSAIFPDVKKWKVTTTSDMNGQKVSLGQEKWNSVEFLSIHLVAIGGKPGEMLVRDMRIEKVQ